MNLKGHAMRTLVTEAKNKTVELEVCLHPSGRRTLKYRFAESEVWQDYAPESPLFSNDNEAEFYGALEREVQRLRVNGCRVLLHDDTASRR
jgi:hypothetical protein